LASPSTPAAPPFQPQPPTPPLLGESVASSLAAEQPTQESRKKTKGRYFSQVDNNKDAISGKTDKTFNEELKSERKVRPRTQDLSTEGGGSPTLSIPTPSKTRKSHQRKRSHSSNKSTFKRRKYTAE
jgi:hypothetical protein